MRLILAIYALIISVVKFTMNCIGVDPIAWKDLIPWVILGIISIINIIFMVLE